MARGSDRNEAKAALPRTHERALWARGVELVAGVDEAGIGPLAGPVVAAAVLLKPRARITGVDDSKKLSAAQREALCEPIRKRALAWSVGVATHAEIDSINIYHAGLLAMRRAVEGLAVRPQHLLVDGRAISRIDIEQTRVVGGDASELCIAAASILAKVHRDALMVELDAAHPGYGFAQHKGYPTAAHREALARLGACAVHRMSYPAVQEICGGASPAYQQLLLALGDARDDDSLAVWRERVRTEGKELSAPEKGRLRAVAARRGAP
jgi:ribonuclease HII